MPVGIRHPNAPGHEVVIDAVNHEGFIEVRCSCGEVMDVQEPDVAVRSIYSIDALVLCIERVGRHLHAEPSDAEFVNALRLLR